MASARMIARALWAAPFAAVAILAAWALHDFLGISGETPPAEFVLPLLSGLVVLVVGLRMSSKVLRRLGLALLAASYFAAHAFVVPPDPGSALGFMVLSLTAVELQIMASRFAPIYAARLAEEDRGRLDDALRRCAIRIGVVSSMAFFGSYLAADLALAGTFPLTSVTTALVLAAALVAVVFLLALWPVPGEQGAPSASEARRIQMPK